jgi:hypothetical protein
MTWYDHMLASTILLELTMKQIKIYEPAILIVGTKGRSLGGFQGLLPGSVSKWVLQHSPVPVIVVRPNSKRAKVKRKRLQDPARTGYRDLLDKSNPQGGGHLLDISKRHSVVPATQTVTEEESAAVAAAIEAASGPVPPGLSEDPLTKVDSTRTDTSAMSPESDFAGRESSPEATRSPVRVMKSPDERNLPTPDLSEASTDEEGVEVEDGSADDKKAQASDTKVAQGIANVSLDERLSKGGGGGTDNS